MDLSQGVMLLDNMSIDLRGRDVGVTQELLHRAQIGTALEQMAGKGVTEYVRRYPRRLDAGSDGERLQLLAEALAGEMLRPVAGREEPRRSRAPSHLVGGERRDMVGKRLASRIVERHQTLAPSLALDGHHLIVAGQHVARQCKKLRHAQAGGV